MILIDNKPLELSLLSEYPDNSIEKQVLNTMTASAEEYRYKTLDELKFELMLRRETVNAAIDLNKSRFSFAIFTRSRCNPDYYERTMNGGFRMKNNVRPSDAIMDIFINGQKYANECATAMVIVYYRALLNVFGVNAFNKVFDKIYLMNWQISEPLLKEIGIPRRVPELLLGDRGYFMNPDVDPKTPEWQGENVIVLPYSMYYGHGIGITTADKIIRALNQNRRRNSTRSAYFMDTAARPNYRKLAKVYYENI